MSKTLPIRGDKKKMLGKAKGRGRVVRKQKGTRQRGKK